MKTKHNNQLTRQIGEHLVVSKLGRLGIFATPFAGNVPDFDVLASDLSGHSIPLQVKTINGGGWQFNSNKFLEIEHKGDCQVVKGEKKLRHPDLVCVFVLLKPDERDEFYIFPLRALQQRCLKGYLKDSKGELFPGGKRPRNPQSTHGAVRPRDLQEYRVKEDRDWSLITKHFSPVTGLGEQDGPANGSQPVRSETDRASSAAGSRR
jgi:hypothetical protein